MQETKKRLAESILNMLEANETIIEREKRHTDILMSLTAEKLERIEYIVASGNKIASITVAIVLF